MKSNITSPPLSSLSAPPSSIFDNIANFYYQKAAMFDIPDVLGKQCCQNQSVQTIGIHDKECFTNNCFILLTCNSVSALV